MHHATGCHQLHLERVIASISSLAEHTWGRYLQRGILEQCVCIMFGDGSRVGQIESRIGTMVVSILIVIVDQTKQEVPSVL